MKHEDMIKELQQIDEKCREMGGIEKLKRRKAKGILNARERIDYLLDDNTFIEYGLHAKSINKELWHKSNCDGKIAGVGKIDGRYVSFVANDFTVLGASSSVINMKKIRHMKRIALEQGIPLILLGESTGARMPDRMGASGRATMGGDPSEYVRKREFPMISVLLGDCYGSSTWYTAISDFTVMRKGAHMAVASHRVTSIAINQAIDPEDLAGWRLHAEKSGMVDAIAENDQEALDLIKQYYSYMPSNNQEVSPEIQAEEPKMSADKILEIFPESRNKGYNVKKIIEIIVDGGRLFELKKSFGKSIVTGLTRLDGKVVGIIANNPISLGGAIDVDAMRKATSFIVHCDSFNIPIIFLVDQPGFLIGVEGERQGGPGKIMNWMNALQLSTVPKITVIMGKDYGQAYLNMCGGQISSTVILWPTADLGFMSPKVGVNILHNVREDEDPELFKKHVEEIQKDSSYRDLAALYEGHMVIDPRQTRNALIRVLDIHRKGIRNGIGGHQLANWPTSY